MLFPRVLKGPVQAAWALPTSELAFPYSSPHDNSDNHCIRNYLGVRVGIGAGEDTVLNKRKPWQQLPSGSKIISHRELSQFFLLACKGVYLRCVFFCLAFGLANWSFKGRLSNRCALVYTHIQTQILERQHRDAFRNIKDMVLPSCPRLKLDQDSASFTMSFIGRSQL